MAAIDPGQLLFWAAVTFFTPLVMLVVPFRRRRLSERSVHLMLGVSAGLLLGISFLDILPESFELGRDAGLSVTVVALGAAAGFLVLLFLQRHLLAHEESTGLVHVEDGKHIHPFGILAMSSLAIHGVMDGIVIPIGFVAGPAVGTVITLAVAIHQIPDSFAAVSVALGPGYTRRRGALYVLVTAVDTPIGMAIGLLFLGGGAALAALGLAFAAGTFIFVSAADLIPELHHRARSGLVSFAILGGIVFVAVLTFLLPA
jgi:zinc transporter ZupT